MSGGRHAHADLFELFWENSKLNEITIRDFGEGIAAHTPSPEDAPPVYPGADIRLPSPSDRLFTVMRQRRSERVFAPRPVSAKQLGSLFAAFGASKTGSRVYASAGGTYALDIFALLLAAEGRLNGRIVHYNADNHSLSDVGPAPSPDLLAETLLLDGEIGLPPVLFLFVLFTARTTQRYGERGGRFALIELGHAAQNLALRIAQEGMVGSEAGGIADDAAIRLLGLDPARAKMGLAYACGHPIGRSRRRAWARGKVDPGERPLGSPT
jgi:SagB-type dehydrogenase family enzyme